MNRSVIAALAAAGTLLVAGCDAPVSAGAPEASAAPVVLEACADLESLPTARCGSITVPLDRADPAAGTTTVGFALVPRTDTAQPSLGTIVPNPGGPGTSTIDLSGVYFAEALAPILDRRDLLLIDPRGVGRSDPIRCPALATPDSVFGTIDAQRAAIGACGRELGDRYRHYGTAAVADDIDDVRAALGLDELDLLGVSYGSYLMPVYAHRHPEHVRSVALAGAYAVNVDPSAEPAAAAFRRAVTLVCERTGKCDGATVLDDLAAVAARLRERPETLDVEYDGTTHPVVLDEWAVVGMASKMYSVTASTEAELALATAAADARTGDLGGIRELVRAHLIDAADTAVAGPAMVSIAASWATTCHDYLRDFDFADDVATRRAAYDRATAALRPADFAPFSPEAWVTRSSFDTGACLEWPNDPTAVPPFAADAVLPDVSVLVLSGDLDANTSTVSGREAAAQFPHATEVEVEGAGHTPAQVPEGARLIVEFIAGQS